MQALFGEGSILFVWAGRQGRGEEMIAKRGGEGEKDIRIMEACNDSFNDLVDGLQGLQSGTVESVVAGYDGKF